MWIRLIVWPLFLATLTGFWIREILSLREALRHHGEDLEAAKPELRRFRRRTLGLVVLVLLALGYDLLHILPFPEPRHQMAFIGVCFILLIWLLLIALRDVRDIADSYSRSRAQATVDALRFLHDRTPQDPGESDRQPIPTPRFDEPEPPPEGIT
ncbi:MAG: hypothetical protein RLY93_11610 [Sumerlaeia bacterium]